MLDRLVEQGLGERHPGGEVSTVEMRLVMGNSVSLA